MPGKPRRKATSKAQRTAAGIARGIQKGQVKAKPGTASARMAKMSPADLGKMAKTKAKGLPRKKSKSKAKKRKKR